MVLTRLKNASVIHGFHEEKVVLHMAVTRADTPGGTVSAANFDGHEEEVQVKLAVELLPPKVGPVTWIFYYIWGADRICVSSACSGAVRTLIGCLPLSKPWQKSHAWAASFLSCMAVSLSLRSSDGALGSHVLYGICSAPAGLGGPGPNFAPAAVESYVVRGICSCRSGGLSCPGTVPLVTGDPSLILPLLRGGSCVMRGMGFCRSGGLSCPGWVPLVTGDPSLILPLLRGYHM